MDPSPRAVIFGCAGPSLTAEERAFFRDAQPLGFILFGRNCRDPNQVRALTTDLRAAVGREDADILIDQEGGRVARLKPPHWRSYPPAARFAELARDDAAAAGEAARLNARLIAEELHQLGISVDCAPVLDVRQPGADAIIGDRAADSPDVAVVLGRAVCEGFLAGGVLPVIKHVPGHGRAGVDSHKALPVVDAARDDLESVDFVPFRALSGMPWAMTAHVVYKVIDPELPATVSATVIESVIRGAIGFDGLLITDDLSMKALSGGLGERTAAALAAGCDVVLHCNGDMAEMEAVAEACGVLSEAATGRLARGAALRRKPDSFDSEAALARRDALLARGGMA